MLAPMLASVFQLTLLQAAASAAAAAAVVPLPPPTVVAVVTAVVLTHSLPALSRCNGCGLGRY